MARVWGVDDGDHPVRAQRRFARCQAGDHGHPGGDGCASDHGDSTPPRSWWCPAPDALLASTTVLDSVVLALRELPDVPEAVIRRVGRARLSLLDVLATEAGLPSQISGGQAKRVGLARATILDPELLFCDEPTSGLDPLTAAQIDPTLSQFRYVFGATIAPDASRPSVADSATLVVRPLSADSAYDTDRIVYRLSPYRIDY